MKNRAEAIAFLRGAGFEATERDWALGETIVVPADPQRSAPGDIVVYRRVIYIVPRPLGWAVCELSGSPTREALAETLDEACLITVRELSTPTVIHDTRPISPWAGDGITSQVDVENRLRAIEWEVLDTAFGPAHRVAEWLWDLRFGHPHLAEEGGHMLWSSLCHQKGQLAEAAEPALPFLLEFLPNVAPPLQCKILDILDGLAVCSSPRYGYPASGYHLRVREMLRGAAAAIATFANHEDADARAFVRRTLAELE